MRLYCGRYSEVKQPQYAEEMQNDPRRGKCEVKENARLIIEIIEHEWTQFDKVNNLGGRASCQDDWKTFRIMRTAQYANWPEDLLESYLEDLKLAESEDRNLIAEKYGRMMESTAPEEYENIKHLFPARLQERLAAQEEIISIEISMDEEFCKKYPVYAAGGRSTHTYEDSLYSTSKETYMRGEMSTWSDQTFDIYAEWVRALSDSGCNLPEMTAENIVREYGFGSLAETEKYLVKKSNKA